MNNVELKKTALKIRRSILDTVYQAQSGHPGGSLSCADVLTYLYFEEMNIDPQQPGLPQRDRFVLSKGHAAPALYAALAHRGYFDLSELRYTRRLGSMLQGHPDMKHTPGVEMSTGSLGQGISAAAGMALGAKLAHQDWRVYVLLGDGEIQEGQVWEAMMFAAQNKLDNLVMIIDNNDLQLDGRLEQICSPYPIDEKVEAFQCQAIPVEDGSDFDQLRWAFARARMCKDRPSSIILKTVKGKGISFMEDRSAWHGKAPNEAEYEQALAELRAAREALYD